MKINKRIAKFGKTACRFGFMFFFMFVSFQVGEIYGKHNTDEQGIIGFFTTEKEFKWDTRGEMPEEVITRVAEYNQIVRYIWMAIAFSVGIMFFDYYIDPKNHFITQLKRRTENDGEMDNQD